MKTFKRNEPVTVKAVELSSENVGDLCVALGFDADALSGTDVEKLMLVIAENGAISFMVHSDFDELYNEQVPRGRKPKSSTESAAPANDKQ